MSANQSSRPQNDDISLPQHPYPLLQPGMPGPLFLEPPVSPMALSSLILGIVGLSALPLIGSIIAVVLGHMSMSEIRRSQGQVRGDGFALAGLILGYIGIGLVLILSIFIIFGIAFVFPTVLINQ